MPSGFMIEVSGFDDGAIIEDTLTLPEIILDFEHSYMGDLLISIRCPSDSVVVLHQEGGGSTFLGEPIDGDDANPVLGTCWEYRFSADPDYGTWVDCCFSGDTPNTVPSGPFNNALRPASYASVGRLGDLVGCPLNGVWTLEVFDLLWQDNGFLCSWCLALPETPEIVLQDLHPRLSTTSLDSNFWSGPFVTNLVPGIATFTPEDPGPGILNYIVVDSYGCSHDTSVVFNVFDELPVSIIDGSGNSSCAVVEGVGFVQQWTREWFYEGVSYGDPGPCWTPPGDGLVTVLITDPSGCSGGAIDLTVGLSEITPPVLGLEIQPVPNDGVFTVLLSGLRTNEALLRITDAVGRSVFARTLGEVLGDLSIPVSMEVSPGVYFVEVTGGGQRLVRRIVVR